MWFVTCLMTSEIATLFLLKGILIPYSFGSRF